MGARFAFNTYQHWRKLVLQVLPIIKVLDKRMEVLPYLVKQLQEWFADNSDLAGFFEAIAIWFNKLCEIGPPQGYIPEPTKSSLITHEKNMEEAIEFFVDFKFKVKEGHHYLGGFISSEEKVQEWMASVKIFADMMPHQPQ
eukprot:9819049-Ditylum_brightwellii.AAC.1